MSVTSPCILGLSYIKCVIEHLSHFYKFALFEDSFKFVLVEYLFEIVLYVKF